MEKYFTFTLLNGVNAGVVDSICLCDFRKLAPLRHETSLLIILCYNIVVTILFVVNNIVFNTLATKLFTKMNIKIPLLKSTLHA